MYWNVCWRGIAVGTLDVNIKYTCEKVWSIWKKLIQCGTFSKQWRWLKYCQGNWDLLFKHVYASNTSVDGNIISRKALLIAAHLDVDICEVGGAWDFPLTSIQCQDYEWLELYLVLIIYLLNCLLHGAESCLRTNQFSTSQEIPILWNPKVLYSI
jgi:hypothetical protein